VEDNLNGELEGPKLGSSKNRARPNAGAGADKPSSGMKKSTTTINRKKGKQIEVVRDLVESDG